MKWAASHVKISWILALLLLIGCLLGANQIMKGPNGIFDRQPPSSESKSKHGESSQRYGATSTGTVTHEGEIVRLAPSGPGEVVEVLVKNGDRVKKGQVLLRMDDRLARGNLEKADAAVAAARAKLGFAKDARGALETKTSIQLDIIKGAGVERDIQQHLVDEYKIRADKKIEANSQAVYDSAKMVLDGANIKVELEKKKLSAIDDEKRAADNQIKLADANLQAAEADRKLAKYALDECELKAREDGTILQSYVSVGTKFGDQAMRPAFDFYSGGLIVEAEVTQEKASAVKEGQRVFVEDAGGSEQTWQGQVTKVDSKFTNKRDQGGIPGIPEQPQDPVLKCRITLDAGKPMPLLNQKVRVKFLK